MVKVVYVPKNVNAGLTVQYSCSRGSIDLTARQEADYPGDLIKAMLKENNGFKLDVEDKSVMIPELSTLGVKVTEKPETELTANTLQAQGTADKVPKSPPTTDDTLLKK